MDACINESYDLARDVINKENEMISAGYPGLSSAQKKEIGDRRNDIKQRAFDSAVKPLKQRDTVWDRIKAYRAKKGRYKEIVNGLDTGIIEIYVDGKGQVSERGKEYLFTRLDHALGKNQLYLSLSAHEQNEVRNRARNELLELADMQTDSCARSWTGGKVEVGFVPVERTEAWISRTVKSVIDAVRARMTSKGNIDHDDGIWTAEEARDADIDDREREEEEERDI